MSDLTDLEIELRPFCNDSVVLATELTGFNFCFKEIKRREIIEERAQKLLEKTRATLNRQKQQAECIELNNDSHGGLKCIIFSTSGTDLQFH